MPGRGGGATGACPAREGSRDTRPLFACTARRGTLPGPAGPCSRSPAAGSRSPPPPAVAVVGEKQKDTRNTQGVVFVVVVVVVFTLLTHRYNAVRGHRTGSNNSGAEN